VLLFMELLQVAAANVVALVPHAVDESLIVLLQELDTMARDNPERFHLWYVVEEPGTAPSPLTHGEDADAVAAAALLAESAPWTYSKGFITPDMMAQHLLPPQPLVLPSSSGQQQQQQGGSLALMCGPPGMLEHVVVPGLSAMGYTAQQMVVF
jgi:NAD(P)H-flavin reductase